MRELLRIKKNQFGLTTHQFKGNELPRIGDKEII